MVSKLTYLPPCCELWCTRWEGCLESPGGGLLLCWVNDADRPQLTKTFGEFGNGTQKHSSKIPKHKYHVGHLRSPDSTHTLLHSSFSNQPDEACDPGVRIHVGDPDDPNLSYPSQGVENHNGDLSASTVDHDGVLHLDRPLSLPLPSALPPLSSPSPPSASLQCPRPPVSSHTHLSSHRSFVGSQDRGLKAPCVIQVYQYNNKAHDNARFLVDIEAVGAGKKRHWELVAFSVK